MMIEDVLSACRSSHLLHLLALDKQNYSVDDCQIETSQHSAAVGCV